MDGSLCIKTRRRRVCESQRKDAREWAEFVVSRENMKVFYTGKLSDVVLWVHGTRNVTRPPKSGTLRSFRRA